MGHVALREIKIKINGKRKTFLVPSNLTLFDLLREELGLISVKDMCLGHGACGSCTVLVEKRAILACLTLAIDCDGKEVETLEGLAHSGNCLIEAFLKNHAFQCGYCTPGFIVSAAALLQENPNPSVDEIVEALSGNICRCGTYPAVINAVIEASEQLRGNSYGRGKKNKSSTKGE